MALVYKTINLWAFRDNNVHILCFAGENLGKEIRFKLINADGSVLELNSSDKVNFYWHPEGYNQSHYIEGLIQTNETGIVSIPVTKEICSVSGRISCVLEVNRAGTTTKFGSINIDITDGVGSVDISNLNSAEYDLIMTMQGNISLLQKKLNDLALNNDPNVEIVEAKGVSLTLKNKIANYDTFAMFPNQTINCIKNSKNFINTDNWESVNTGTLSATGYSLKAVSEDNFGIYGSLEKDLPINYNKTIMVKARVRCISGTSCTVKPCWRKNTNGVLIAPEYIAAGNMDVSTANNSVSWNLPIGKRWRDIWFIAFDGGSGTTINQIGFFISSGTTVEIGHFEVFYSQDKGLTNGELEALKSDVTQNKSDIDDLQTDVTGLETRMGTVEGNITTAEGKINNLSDDVLQNETDIYNLQNTVAQHTTDIAANATNISALQTKTNTNTANITTNTNAIATANQNIATNTANISDLQAFVGYTNDDILGLQVDYANKTFTRLAGAVGKEAGADFDSFAMYGGRKRCNVANDGTINAYYGDEGYSDTGSNGQVMVYQPAFYYKVVPLKLDKNTDSGIGYHIRKANYYVSATPHTGFKLHPAFYDENGNAVDYILFSAYEGSLYSNGHIVSDDSETEKTLDLSTDYLCSVANQKPISGLYKPLTKTNSETLAKNNGAGWHIDTIKSVSANQLLMMIELGTMNTQSAIGLGVVSITENSSYNCSSLTGSTANLGNSTGMAVNTVNRQGSTTTTYTENGKVAVSYRGMENPWGNIWKHINGINIWGDGTMCGGQAYVADDFNFNESKRDGNYNAVGFTLPNTGGYINAIGYGFDKYDWLFIPSEIGGNSSSPVGDNIAVSTSLKIYKIIRFGGGYNYSSTAGAFQLHCSGNVGDKNRAIGARLLYIPTARR